MKLKRLGIDVGGVIIDRVNDGTDTSFFSDNYLKTTAVPRAIETITRLSREKFGAGNVFLVSKCGEVIEVKTRKWLARRDFHRVTGIPIEQVNFCREWSDKAPICKTLGITHFVDDKLQVLGHMEGIVETRFLFNPDEHEVTRYQHHLRGVVRVKTWDEVFGKISV